MSTEESKSPYFSMRVHIGELTTQKHMGVKTRSIEVTYGNMETVTIRDRDDIANVIKSTPISEKVWEVWDDVTEKGRAKGHQFTEDVRE